MRLPLLFLCVVLTSGCLDSGHIKGEVHALRIIEVRDASQCGHFDIGYITGEQGVTQWIGTDSPSLRDAAHRAADNGTRVVIIQERVMCGWNAVNLTEVKL